MPSKIHVHTDFSGGVVDRRIEGRTDANQYDKTMRAADNFVVTRSGTLRRRPGTIYLGDAFTRGGTTGSMSNTSITQDFRLVPWDTSDGVRSLLAIGKTMVSLYENEAPSVTPDGVRGGTAKFIRPINRSGTPAFIGQEQTSDCRTTIHSAARLTKATTRQRLKKPVLTQRSF